MGRGSLSTEGLRWFLVYRAYHQLSKGHGITFWLRGATTDTLTFSPYNVQSYMSFRRDITEWLKKHDDSIVREVGWQTTDLVDGKPYEQFITHHPFS